MSFFASSMLGDRNFGEKVAVTTLGRRVWPANIPRLTLSKEWLPCKTLLSINFAQMRLSWVLRLEALFIMPVHRWKQSSTTWLPKMMLQLSLHGEPTGGSR